MGKLVKKAAGSLIAVAVLKSARMVMLICELIPISVNVMSVVLFNLATLMPLYSATSLNSFAERSIVPEELLGNALVGFSRCHSRLRPARECDFGSVAAEPTSSVNQPY